MAAAADAGRHFPTHDEQLRHRFAASQSPTSSLNADAPPASSAEAKTGDASRASAVSLAGLTASFSSALSASLGGGVPAAASMMFDEPVGDSLVTPNSTKFHPQVPVSSTTSSSPFQQSTASGKSDFASVLHEAPTASSSAPVGAAAPMPKSGGRLESSQGLAKYTAGVMTLDALTTPLPPPPNAEPDLSMVTSTATPKTGPMPPVNVHHGRSLLFKPQDQRQGAPMAAAGGTRPLHPAQEKGMTSQQTRRTTATPAARFDARYLEERGAPPPHQAAASAVAAVGWWRGATAALFSDGDASAVDVVSATHSARDGRAGFNGVGSASQFTATRASSSSSSFSAPATDRPYAAEAARARQHAAGLPLAADGDSAPRVAVAGPGGSAIRSTRTARLATMNAEAQRTANGTLPANTTHPQSATAGRDSAPRPAVTQSRPKGKSYVAPSSPFLLLNEEDLHDADPTATLPPRTTPAHVHPSITPPEITGSRTTTTSTGIGSTGIGRSGDGGGGASVSGGFLRGASTTTQQTVMLHAMDRLAVEAEQTFQPALAPANPVRDLATSLSEKATAASESVRSRLQEFSQPPRPISAPGGPMVVTVPVGSSSSSSSSNARAAASSLPNTTAAAVGGDQAAVPPQQTASSDMTVKSSVKPSANGATSKRQRRVAFNIPEHVSNALEAGVFEQRGGDTKGRPISTASGAPPAPSLPHAVQRPGMLRTAPLSAAAVAAPSGDVSSTVFAMRLGSTFDALAPSGSANSTRIPSTTPAAVTMPAVTAARPVGVRRGGWDLPLLFTQRHNEQRDATAALAMTTGKEATAASAAGALTVVPSAVALVAPHRPAALPYIVASSTAHRDSAESQAKSAEAAAIIAEAQDRPRPRWERAMFASVASSLDAIHAARATDDAGGQDPAVADALPGSGGLTKVAVPSLPFATNAAATFAPACDDDDEDTVGASPFAPAPEVSDTLPFEERTRLQFPESTGFEDDSRAPASVIVSHTRRELRRTAPASTAHESTTPRSVVLHEFSEEEGDVAPLYTPFAVPLPSAGLVDKIIFGRDANATPGRSAAISRSASVAQTPWMSAAPTPRHARAALRSADGRFPDTASMYGGPSAERNDKPSPGSLLTDVLRDVRGAKKDIRGLRPLPADAVAKLAAMEGHGKHTPCLKTDVRSAEVHAVMLLDHWRFAARQYGSSPLSAAALANLEARFGSPALLSSPAMTHAASVRDDHQLLRGHRDRILCHAAEMDMTSRQHSFGGPGACGFKFDYDTDDDDGASSVHPLSLSTMERHHRMPALISTPPQSGRGAEYLYSDASAALDGGTSTSEFPLAPLPAASKDYAFGAAPFAAGASPVPFDGQLDQDAAFFFEEELSRAQEQAHLAYPVDDAVTHIGCACCDQPLSKFAARRVAAPPAVCCHATCLVRGEYILTHGGGTVKGACSTFRVLHVPTRQWFAPRVTCVDEAGFVFGTGLQYTDAAANSTTQQEQQQHQSQSQDGSNLVFPDLTLFGHSAVAVCQGNWAVIIGGRPSPLGEEEEPTPEITMPDASTQNQTHVPSSGGATSATSEAAGTTATEGAAAAQGHAAAVEAASRPIALFAVDLRALVERMEIVVHRLPQDPDAATDCDDAGWGLPSSSELEDAQVIDDAHEGADEIPAARDMSHQEGIHNSSGGRASASETSSRSPSVASVWSAHSARGALGPRPRIPGPRSLHTATLVSRLDDPHTARIAVLMGLGRALECLPDAWCLMLRSNTLGNSNDDAGTDTATSVRSDHHAGEQPSRSEQKPPFTVRWLPLPLALPPHLEGGVGGHSAVLSQQRPGDRGVKRLFLFGGRRNDGGFVPGCHVYDPMMGLLAPLPQQTLHDATAAASDQREGNPSRTAQLHNGTGIDGRELSTGGDFFNAAFSLSEYSSSSQASSTPRRANGVVNGEPGIEGPMLGPAAGACTFPQGRYAHAAWPDGQGGFFIHGGDREGTYFSDVWRFHGGPMAWECLDGEGTTPLSGLAPRSGHGAVVHHGAVYLLGGEAVVSMDDPPPSGPQRPVPSTTTTTGSNFLDATAPMQHTGGGTTIGVAAPAASHEDAASLSSGPFPPSTTASTGLPPPSIVATGTPVHFDAGGLFPHVPSSSTMSPVLHRSGEEFLRSPNIPGVGSWDDAGHPVDPAHHHHHHSNSSFPRSVASPTQPEQAHLPHPHPVQPQQPQEQQSQEQRTGRQPSGGHQEQMSRSRLASVDTTEYRDMHFTVPGSGSDDFYEGGEASPTTADGFDPPSAHPAGQASDHAGQISSGSGSSEAVPGVAQASSLPSGAHEEARGVTVRLRYFRATPEWHFRPFDAQRSLKALCCAWLMHAEQADDSDFGV